VAHTFIVKVLNWSKYQSDHGRNTYIWFRFHHGFFRHGQALKLGPDGTFLFTYLLCECADRKTDELTIYSPITTAQLGWNHTKLIKTLKSLSDAGCIAQIEYEASHTAVPDRIEENRIEYNDDFDFEILYKQYPRKEGKQSGMKICRREITTPELFGLLDKAIQQYAAHCRASGTERRFIKQFSTFMACWRDYLEPDFGSDPGFSKSKLIDVPDFN